jgi:hypothetical protein
MESVIFLAGPLNKDSCLANGEEVSGFETVYDQFLHMFYPDKFE